VDELKLLWKPSESRLTNSNLTAYTKSLNEKYHLNLKNYHELYDWSVKNIETFWTSLMDYFQVKYEGSLTPASKDLSFKKYPWFPNVRLNFAQNLLLQKDPGKIAIEFVHESGLKKQISRGDLFEQVSKISYFFSQYIKAGDVVGAYMPNCPETMISMLAASSLGGVFTSTSCDFGVQGVIDRFSQSNPKVLVICQGYEYNGKYFDLTERIPELLKGIPSLEAVVVADFLGKGEGLKVSDEKIFTWNNIITQKHNHPLRFTNVKFSDPLYIMYSSGTTGKPKCIVHSVGGTLLQHLKELALHSDLKENDKLFFFTTCGWMMWNWMASGIALGTTVVLYEGSPSYPTFDSFMNFIDETKVTLWGTSPKFLRALELHAWKKKNNFAHLKTIASTGSPLLPEQYDYVYQMFGPDILLSSISGGTDIIACFMLGSPTLPVYRGEIQCRGLGMAVDCVDENAKSLVNKEGELVCRLPFISQPIEFLNDENCEKINAAYFDVYPGLWHHGDFIRISDQGTIRVFGRSDATLNPGGVRIGTGEVYRQTEKISYLDDSLCVGVDKEGDVDIWLFVKLKNEQDVLTDAMKKEIKQVIKSNTTPRHVPKEIKQVKGIPYTRSGKKMELAINRILNGKKLTNLEAVANPECLKEYEQYLQKN
jgi:acetoacetyl-CoA synthetase